MNARQTAEEIVTTWARYECAELFLEGPLHMKSRERLVAAIEAAIVRAMQAKPERSAEEKAASWARLEAAAKEAGIKPVAGRKHRGAV
jgi:hypothetical protein